MKKTNPISCNEIKRIAANLRKEFNISYSTYFPIYEIICELEKEGLITIQIMDNNDALFADNIPAFYNSYDNFIYIKESVLEEYENKEYRSNFTLAHELFHFIQHKVLGFDFEEVDSCVTYCDPEWQANEFAGQLLIPEEFIDLETEQLINKFHVSEYCVLTRKLKYKKRQK